MRIRRARARTSKSSSNHHRLESRILRPEGVADPIDRCFSCAIVVDRNDIEAHDAVRKLRPSRDKQRRGPNELVLLVPVDGQLRPKQGARAPKAYFHEHELRRMSCDQVDFTEPAAEIACDGREPMLDQKLFGDSFGVAA